ncbi:hypothetical protein VTH8203_01497 [Vibrio thalassae]|uniref:DUF83 domain-containing protein n=1 Tax=Vibrio thalassae TaxID=1243014 RepID=A0A240EGT7_9VIBR|nr:Dna2/Cas4 domain-containing protein [Vibrio thalassae]SNX47882.1 hypothetical protein VTH8203_01497 [Vibrio thalassae]
MILETLQTQLQQYWLEILWLVAACYLAIQALMLALDKLYLIVRPLPETQFGFKGHLVYCDDKPNSKCFVNHRYQLSAKPDFIYRTGRRSYTVVEYKSRNAPVKESDINQLIAAVVAARPTYPITNAFVVTKKQSKQIPIYNSTHANYKRIAHLHKIARRIKHSNYYPKPKKAKQCFQCGYYDAQNEQCKKA